MSQQQDKDSQPFNADWNLITNSPYCLQYTSHDVTWENLILHQLIISQMIFLFILITLLLDLWTCEVLININSIM